MKNQIKYIAALLFGILFVVTACTDKFEYMNTELGAYTPDKQIADSKYGNKMYFNTIQRSIYFNDPAPGGTDWTFQTMQNLNVDMFAGYFHDMASKFTDMNSTYNLNDGWNGTNWTYTYQYGVSALNKSMDANVNCKPYLALCKIYKVAMLHRLADQYGAILYSDFENYIPESQEKVYTAMFADIDQALSWIDESTQEGIALEIIDNITKFDILMKNDKTLAHYAKWANSLRLRLAMRISNVNPKQAATEVTKALQDPHGLIETNAENVAVFADGSNYKNPLGTIGLSWWEVYMNASMESFLVGYNDPRTNKYFTPSVGGTEGLDASFKPRFDYKGMQKGIPQGFNYNTPAECNHYKYHSRSTIQITTDAPLMTASEVWFLRAEAKLREFTGANESVQNCYEKAVRLSFEQWGATNADEYLQSNSQPSDYKDVFFESNDMKAVSTITPKWDENASKEVKLERIITQKWLALYPEGAEAWAEQRRTGYPHLFKVLTNHSNGLIDTNKMVRRLPFPSGLASSFPDLYQQLVGALGGADNGGTDVWWSVGKNNF